MTADLNGFVARFAEIDRARVPSGIRFDVGLDADLPPVAFDAVQSTEILEALVVNALEAMNGSGRLDVRTASRPDRERPAALRVSDTGPGIDSGPSSGCSISSTPRSRPARVSGWRP